MNRPNLYCLVDVPTGGDFGAGTGSLELTICAVCRRRKRPPDYTIVEVEFEEWSGEDLMMSEGHYLVSQRLRSHLESAGVQGASYEDIIVSVSPEFEISPPAYDNDIPMFYRWHIRDRLEGPDVWWSSTGRCQTCGESAWAHAAGYTAVQLEKWDEAPVRAAYADTWNGSDVFLLKDPGPPMISERVVGVLRAVGVIGIEVRPARWVDR